MQDLWKIGIFFFCLHVWRAFEFFKIVRRDWLTYNLIGRIYLEYILSGNESLVPTVHDQEKKKSGLEYQILPV